MMFGPWTPDKPAFGHEGLVVARNVLPGPLGYEPVKEYSAITTALDSTFRGGGAFKGVDGTIAMLAGLDDGLYSYSAPTWSNEVTDTYTGKWQFAQFGDLVICANGSAPLKYTISTGAGATLGGTPPDARYVVTVKDFVFLAGDPAANSTVAWSAINNAESWTPGTGQSDTQILPDGGAVTGLAGGEYLLAFQPDQIWRAQFVGPPLIYQFDKIVSGIGTVAGHSIAQAGRTVFFYSGRGFYALTDGQLQPIGTDAVDETFAGLYSESEIEENITSAIDPVRKVVFWAMPGRLWCYDWGRDRWTYIDGAFHSVANGVTQSYTFEEVAALYPGGMETAPGSFDDPIWRGGAPFLLVAADDDTLGSLGGADNLEATLTLPRMETVKGRETHVWGVRLDSDATSSVTLTIEGRSRLGDSARTFTSISIRDNGDMPIRANGRYIQPSFVFAAGATWTYAEGMEIRLATPGGRQ